MTLRHDDQNDSPRDHFRHALREKSPPPEDAVETELKFLATDSHPDLFIRTIGYFLERGMVMSSLENRLLHTRQFDTPDRQLGSRATSLRIRGTMTDSGGDTYETPDICFKAQPIMGKSGALRRGEWETPIDHFYPDHPPVQKLLDHYDPSQHPLLHQHLGNINPADLQEMFRIQDKRSRYVVRVGADETGIGKDAYVELILDNVYFMAYDHHTKNKNVIPLHIIGHDKEIECEILFKPCKYDSQAGLEKFVTPRLTDDETEKVMDVMRAHILRATDHRVEPNIISKAERGFTYLDTMHGPSIGNLTAEQNDSDWVLRELKRRSDTRAMSQTGLHPGII